LAVRVRSSHNVSLGHGSGERYIAHLLFASSEDPVWLDLTDDLITRVTKDPLIERDDLDTVEGLNAAPLIDRVPRSGAERLPEEVEVIAAPAHHQPIVTLKVYPLA
jgi:hypothetical protein